MILSMTFRDKLWTLERVYFFNGLMELFSLSFNNNFLDCRNNMNFIKSHNQVLMLFVCFFFYVHSPCVNGIYTIILNFYHASRNSVHTKNYVPFVNAPCCSHSEAFAHHPFLECPLSQAIFLFILHDQTQIPTSVLFTHFKNIYWVVTIFQAHFSA